MSIRTLIVDDHEVAREGIAKAVGGSDIEVVGLAATATEGMELIGKISVDVVLIDVRLGEMGGLEMLEEVRKSHPDVAVVMVSTFDNPTYVARAVAIGAKDYLLKSDSRDLFIEAIKRAATGQDAAPRGLLRRIRSAMELSGSERGGVDLPLTNREVQVLRHMALGLSNKEIARSLEISVETVKEHIQNVLRKLNAADRTDAAVRAVKQGLLMGL